MELSGKFGVEFKKWYETRDLVRLASINKANEIYNVR